MKQRILSVVIFSLIVSSAFSQSNLIINNDKFESNIKLLESWIKAQLDYRDIPGMSIGIVYDQELIYAQGFGFCDLKNKKPATPQTLYRIASITKTFTATAILQLRDEGKIRLDDPIKMYLPWFKIKNRFTGAPKITIRHLITHTSGLPREAAFPYWTDHKFPTRKEIIEALPNQETIYAPETKFKYSNLALALTGEIVTAVSAMPYDMYIKKNILEPLQMNSTSVYLTEADMSELATPYSRRLPDGTREIMPFIDSKGITPAANMSSNVEDLARYISLQFGDGKRDGAQILKRSTLREMHRVHWLRPNWSSGWGLGFAVWRQNDKTVVGHGGWVAGNRTQIVFIPKEKIGVIVLTNADDGEPGFFAGKILTLFTPIIKELVTPKAPASKPDPAWNKFVGLYTDPSWFDSEVMIFNNKLVMNGYSFPPEENPAGEIVELTPEGENRFRKTGKNGNGEIVVFELDDKGKVVRVKVGENFIYPKK